MNLVAKKMIDEIRPELTLMRPEKQSRFSRLTGAIGKMLSGPDLTFEEWRRLEYRSPKPNNFKPWR
jgi:hypothetical protein